MHYRFNIHYIRSFLLRQVIYTSLSSIFRFSSTESYYNMNFLYFSCLSDGLNEQVIGVLSFNSGGDDCNCDTSQNPAGLCLFSPSAIYSSVDRLDECEPLCTSVFCKAAMTYKKLVVSTHEKRGIDTAEHRYLILFFHLHTI